MSRHWIFILFATLLSRVCFFILLSFRASSIAETFLYLKSPGSLGQGQSDVGSSNFSTGLLRSHRSSHFSGFIWFFERPPNFCGHTSFRHATYTIHMALQSCFVYLRKQVQVLLCPDPASSFLPACHPQNLRGMSKAMSKILTFLCDIKNIWTDVEIEFEQILTKL